MKDIRFSGKTFQIISNIKYQFYCKTCKHETNSIYKNNGKSYCPTCVTEDVKKNSIKINDNGDIIN